MRNNRGVANQLASATSPYLLQHAHNPVDWLPWSQQAFNEARERNVPVFISIGYSACHWCHVMAHESFEDPVVAGYLNDHFVCIKVDREEHPDVDSVYMDATVAMTGHGGWPMSVFTNHDGHPFYTGTYFPPVPRHGMASFAQILAAIAQAWDERREDLDAAGVRITQALESRVLPDDTSMPTDQTLTTAVQVLARDFDAGNGGFGDAPKFPPSMVLEFLLRMAAVGDQQAGAMAERTLEAMGRGGMYDQLGGGFARYSVDRAWVVPHFEKMLYDNALLLAAYGHWYRLTGSPFAERIVKQTVEFLLRDLRTTSGAFASALDADSEGSEGAFYVWSPQQLQDVLGVEDGHWAASILRVTSEGTFELGASTLQLPVDPDDDERFARIRGKLFDARAARVHPARDDKVLVAWNGLTIAGLAQCGSIFDRSDWIKAARRCADAILVTHTDPARPGRVVRTSRDGIAGYADGVLEDYAHLAHGLLALYQATGESEWLELAGVLLDSAIAHFADDQGGFFATADDGQPLIIRPRDPSDGAEPSGWFSIADAALTYAALTGKDEYRVIAEEALRVVVPYASTAPRMAGWGLAAAAAMVAGPVEIAVAGAPDAPGFTALLAAARAVTSPGAVIAFGDDCVELMAGRIPVDGHATAYVCQGFTCTLPVQTTQDFAAQVQALTR